VSTDRLPSGEPRASGPRVIAHRGASDILAEHTLAAYLQAIEDGADGLECDVRLTADGHLVCVHDRSVRRTSNGRGVVSTLELAELERLDWGSWKNPWADLDDEGPDLAEVGVLTLDRLLQVIASAPRPIELAVETKHPTRYGGLVERRVVEVLAAHGAADGSGGRVRVMSFSWASLRRLRGLAPALSTVYLLDRASRRLKTGELPRGVRALGPSIDLVRRDRDLVARVHARGHQVHVWTVNDPPDVELCADLGVDVLITDRPRDVRAQLAPRGRGET